MSKGVHNIVFYVSPDPECSRTTQNSEISLAPSRGHILYAIYGNSTCVINHIVVTAIDKRYRNYYVSTLPLPLSYFSFRNCRARLTVQPVLAARVLTKPTTFLLRQFSVLWPSLLRLHHASQCWSSTRTGKYPWSPSACSIQTSVILLTG